MGTKISIIGAGSVGATIAYTMANSPVVSEIVLIDINKGKAVGEAMDILQCTAFRDPIQVYAGEYEDAKNSDIVIITSGVARKPGQSRLDLTKINVEITKSIAREVVKAAPDAKYIIVSNPVDILTYTFLKETGVPESQVIGSGTMLDTARLRSCLAEHFAISQKNIHAYVFGEHGDSSFIPWSTANIAGISFNEYCDHFCQKGGADIDCAAVEDYVHKSGGRIIANKGATFYAVSVAVCRLCDYLLGAYDSVAVVSSMLHGEYGIEDVCLSLPTVIGPQGLKDKVVLDLTDEEVKKLQNSANVLKGIIRDINL